MSVNHSCPLWLSWQTTAPSALWLWVQSPLGACTNVQVLPNHPVTIMLNVKPIFPYCSPILDIPCCSLFPCFVLILALPSILSTISFNLYFRHSVYFITLAVWHL